MIICISGLTGSGKTTIAKMLARELNIGLVGDSYKKFAKDPESLIKFLKEVKPKFEKDFDKTIIKKANAGDCVVTTWLGPWLIKNSDLNVFLSASFKARVKRKAADFGSTIKIAESYVRRKDSLTAKNFKRTYRIDIMNDHSVFDIELNTERLKRSEIVSLIAMLSIEKSKVKFG
jgi:cytidylate kinase